MKKPTQRIRYVRSTDGVRLAWAEAGTGPVLIKAANWSTHLEYEWESPVWRHWIRFFSEAFARSGMQGHWAKALELEQQNRFVAAH